MLSWECIHLVFHSESHNRANRHKNEKKNAAPTELLSLLILKGYYSVVLHGRTIIYIVISHKACFLVMGEAGYLAI